MMKRPLARKSHGVEEARRRNRRRSLTGAPSGNRSRERLVRVVADAEQTGEVGSGIAGEGGAVALLDGSAVLEDQDAPGAVDGGEAMGDHDGGAASEEPV